MTSSEPRKAEQDLARFLAEAWGGMASPEMGVSAFGVLFVKGILLVGAFLGGPLCSYTPK